MRVRRSRSILVFMILIAPALLVGCGQVTSASGDQSPPPTVANGAVRLTVGASSYHGGDTIIVTITNTGGHTIYFGDHLTNCSVIQLQRQSGGTWQPIKNCVVLTPTRQHSLDAGKELKVTLTAPTHGSWQTGTYRAALSYSTSPHDSGITTVSTTAFQVR